MLDVPVVPQAIESTGTQSSTLSEMLIDPLQQVATDIDEVTKNTVIDFTKERDEGKCLKLCLCKYINNHLPHCFRSHRKIRSFDQPV